MPSDTYFGFYWTLPINWAPFRHLPRDVDAAAAASRTIRYQRERVRRWVAGEGGRLVGEYAFMEKRPDRATEATRSALERARDICTDGQARLVYVNFAERNYWRSNDDIRHVGSMLGFGPIDLGPDPLEIDGRLFDPVEHFKRFRTTEKEKKTEFKDNARKALTEALRKFPADEHPFHRWQEISDELNALGIRTKTGREWNPESVRKAATQLEASG